MTTASAAALQPLIVDCAAEDGVTPAQVDQLGHAGDPWAGMIFQCSNGLSAAGSWFNKCWAAARAQLGYGTRWLRGAYHYLRVDESPADQADLALAAVLAAGGFDIGDFWLGVDVERGEQPSGATAAQVVAAVSAFAARILARTGKRPMLYAGSYTRGLGISSRMGCSLLWFPEWTGTLDQRLLWKMGWDLDTTELWQIVGDGSNTAPPGYPHTTPIGPLDISVMVRANLPYSQGMEWTRTHTGAQPT